MASPSGLLVVGVGTAYRGDDEVGLLVARRLRKSVSGHATVIEASGEGPR